MQNSIPNLSRHELGDWLTLQGPRVLIDTSLPEDFSRQHLPGAVNACVFEIDFLDQVAKLDGIQTGLLAETIEAGPDRDVPIAVYGACSRSLASATAAEKLQAAGYTNVADYRGGLEEWLAAGLPVEGNGEALKSPPALDDRDYRIEQKESVVEWTGRSLGGKHQGTIELRPGGRMTLQGGRVVAGSFTLVMASLRDTDLEDPAMKEMLEAHLKSDDFFNVEKFPEAQFTLETVEPLADAPLGHPNYRVHGRLLLKGVEKPLQFPAQIGFSPTGDRSLVARANFDFDRTEWNVLYGSGKFYEKLGKHLVSNLITLDLKIVAR